MRRPFRAQNLGILPVAESHDARGAYVTADLPPRPSILGSLTIVFIGALGLPAVARAADGPQLEIRGGMGVSGMLSAAQRDQGFHGGFVPDLRPGLRVADSWTIELVASTWIFPRTGRGRASHAVRGRPALGHASLRLALVVRRRARRPGTDRARQPLHGRCRHRARFLVGARTGPGALSALRAGRRSRHRPEVLGRRALGHHELGRPGRRTAFAWAAGRRARAAPARVGADPSGGEALAAGA